MQGREQRLPEVLRRVRTRLRTEAAARGAIAGLTVAIVLLLVAQVASFDLLLLVLAGASSIVLLGGLFARRVRTHPVALALAVERRAPDCRNLVVTAAELMTGTAQASEGMRALVLRQAEARLRNVEIARAFPLTNPLLLLAGLTAAWAVLAWWSSPVSESARNELRVTRALAPGAPLTIASVRATVSPPRYSGRADMVLRDPDRIEALAGSSVHLSMRTNARHMWLVIGVDTLALDQSDGAFTGRFAVDEDGFVVLLAAHAQDSAPVRRMIGIAAVADVGPRVQITQPGRDLFVPDSNRTIAVSIDAVDDLALASLQLRYTKVSGSGERFTFEDGEIPVRITRASRAEWKASASLSLAALGLARGDVLVYRAVAADMRPGVPPAESDAFIVEIMATSGDAVDGFSFDPEEDRYAVSQQMIIVKTERLLERQATMSRAELVDASRNLSIEQRRVRAEFVFMMGGELAEEVAHEASMDDLDESHHAEAEAADLTAGRTVNPSRTAIFAAIRAMSRAMTALEGADLPTALVHERRAVVELEKAFARTRYLLRAFSQRERLDLTRRLTGNMTDASSFRASASTPVSNARATQLRMVLHEMQRLAADSAVVRSNSYAQLAEVVLSLDPSSRRLQDIAAQLARISREHGGGAMRAVHDSVTRSLVEMLAQSVGASRQQPPVPALRVLEGRARDLRGDRQP